MQARAIVERTSRRAFVSSVLGLGASISALIITDACGSVGTAPFPRKTPRVGFVRLAPRETDLHLLQAFTDGLATLGYVNGQTIAIEWRFAAGREELLPELVAELIRIPVDLIFTTSTQTARVASQSTSHVPIVFVGVADPVESGLVGSLARPAGNLTGFSILAPQLSAKRVQLLADVVPDLSSLGVLWNPAEPASAPQWTETQSAADRLGIRLESIEVRRPEDFDGVLVTGGSHEALLGLAHPLIFAQRRRVVEFAARTHLPGMWFWREFADDGGLMAYAPNLAAMYRRATGYVDKILHGAKPGDLPIEQPTDFEFVVNLAAVHALGLTIPRDVAAQVTEWVE
jgi:putative ABC transport system substrate-binding protein